MAASFGVEAIRHFGNARSNGVSSAADLTYTFNRSNGFDRELRSAGHARSFYFADQNCWENDLEDTGSGGDDLNFADDVDLFWIETHGNHTADGQARLLYDVPQDQWRTFSGTWELGEQWNAEWIMAYSCDTAALPTITGLWNIFAGLHLYCGAWSEMWDGITTDECGEDVADNLTDGDTVSEAWIDGVSDWYFDNHPVVVGPGTRAAWNGGQIRWELSPHNTDHLWGHGAVSPDLTPAQQGCLLWRWAEG
jgi:hypothetical protein